eukprot:gene11314-23672_t
MTPDEILTRKKAAIFLHLIFAFLFVGSIITASVLRFYVALNSKLSPASVGILLSLVRPLIPLVVISLLGIILFALFPIRLIILNYLKGTIGFGVWAVKAYSLDYDTKWLIVTYAMVGWMLIVGAITGKHDRITREMAVAQGSPHAGIPLISDELKVRLRSPLSLILNTSMIISIIIVIAMMVYRPVD